MFQIRRMYFSNRLTVHKVIIKVWHSFVIKNCNIFQLLCFTRYCNEIVKKWREILHFSRR